MIGEILNGRYRIQKLIGSGGMSEVYRAEQLITKRYVSIKILKEECRDNPEYLRRFEREARTVLHLSHENIVRAYDVGTHNGIPYIVMEYIEGKTLKQLLEEQGAFPQKTAVNYCAQVLSALSVAHEAGIIHRDVKPQNVLVTSDGVAKLTDFGIAREVQASTVTFAGSTVLGSAHYLSPEQAKGQPVTEESDLYSVGVMLYEMLTGNVPFDGDSSVSIALKQINEAPLPPMDLNPEIYPSINEVVLCAMQKNPSLRFSSASQMLRALKRASKNRDYHPTLQNLEKEQKEEDASRWNAFEDIFEGLSRQIHASWKIAIVIGVFFVAFIGTFFGIRSAFSGKPSRTIVPSLTGKPIAEAEARAEGYGFSVNVSEYEVDSDSDFGTVLSQSPTAGQKAKAGTEISVTVSAGPDIPSVPNLVGMTYDEAVSAITSAGFTLGNVSYQLSDIAIGYVCSQDPAAGADYASGEPVNVIISATTALSSTMPNLLLLPLEDAVDTLEELGDYKVLIEYDPSAEAGDYDAVILQQPPEGSILVTDMLIYLTTNGVPETGLAMDVAFTVDIPKSNTPVVVAITGDIDGYPVERILYKSVLEAGEKVPISLTATAPSAGIYELILYVDNIETMRKEISFESKE